MNIGNAQVSSLPSAPVCTASTNALDDIPTYSEALDMPCAPLHSLSSTQDDIPTQPALAIMPSACIHYQVLCKGFLQDQYQVLMMS